MSASGGNRNKNQSSQKLMQTSSTTVPTPATSKSTRRMTTVQSTITTTIAPTPSRPRRPYPPVASASNVNTKPKRKDTNTLLESALKQDNFVKILKAPPVAEVTTFENPTTVKDEDATEITTTNEPSTTITRTTPQFLYTRIIPDLLESSNYVRVPQVEPNLNALLSAQQSSAADDLIRNIKQLQNSLSASASSTTTTTTAVPPSEKPSPSVRVALPRRFLFKADSQRNKLKP